MCADDVTVFLLWIPKKFNSLPGYHPREITWKRRLERKWATGSAILSSTFSQCGSISPPCVPCASVTTEIMKKLAIHFLLVTSCLTISVCDGFLQLNRTDSAGVQHTSAAYWLYASKLRPALEAFHPAVRIWLNGVVGDRLADAASGFTKIITINGKRFPLLRKLVRSRILRWIAFLGFLKVAFSLFVIVVLPNIYFYAMTKMRD